MASAVSASDMFLPEGTVRCVCPLTAGKIRAFNVRFVEQGYYHLNQYRCTMHYIVPTTASLQARVPEVCCTCVPRLPCRQLSSCHLVARACDQGGGVVLHLNCQPYLDVYVSLFNLCCFTYGLLFFFFFCCSIQLPDEGDTISMFASIVVQLLKNISVYPRF